MNEKSLLAVASLSVAILFGFQALNPPSIAFTLTVTVDVRPETINLNREGRWITVYIGLPEGYNVSEIDTSSILLEGMFSPEWSNVECDMLMAKFDSTAVIGYLWERLYHMGESQAFIELMVIGELMDGTPLEGKDTVRIMDPVWKQ